MRVLTVLGLLQLCFVVTVSARAQSSAPLSLTAQGSSAIRRAQVDTSPGQVYIYVGGSFPTGTRPAELKYLFDFTTAGNTTGYLTPLLFERVSGEYVTYYVVRGIGDGFFVSLNPLPGRVPFEIAEGLGESTNGNFTFGFVNAIVDSAGNQLDSSPGTVDLDNPADSGPGIGGRGTNNDWAVTNVSPVPVVAIGTTFGVSGADYIFYGASRTYSAEALGIEVN